MSERQPFFSIIIPTYNRAEKLRRALASLETQSFRDFEVIVCDDGSTDDTGQVVKSFTEKFPLRYLREENWGGPARPRNNGLKLACGEWVCFLDADDWWYPGKLATVFTKTPDADVIYHFADTCRDISEKGSVLRVRQLKVPIFADLMTKGNALITSGTCVKKLIIDRVGGYSEDKELIAVEDYDLWLRIARISERFVRIPTSLAAYWVDGGNISVSSEKSIAREIAVHKKFAGFLDPTDRLESEKVLAYKIGLAMKQMGLFRDSRSYFIQALGARHWKRKLYSLLNLLSVGLKSHFD